MARYRQGQKALYEVMSQERYKKSSSKTLEQLRPVKSPEDTVSEAKPQMHTSKRVTDFRIKPKLLQVNAGRIEISIPYQIVIALLLGLIVIILIAYRLGQFSQTAADSTMQTQTLKPLNSTMRDTETVPQQPVTLKETSQPDENIIPPDSSGNNRIVIQSHGASSQLEPVKEYFAQFNIQTEIRRTGDWYILVTRNKYQNPDKQGTDGYAIKKKIIEIGQNYKAPPGYEPFAPNFFKDAYGMKFED